MVREHTLDLRVPSWHALVYGRHSRLPARIAEAGQLVRKGGSCLIGVLSTHGSQSPCLGSSQLPQRVHLVSTCAAASSSICCPTLSAI